jgi:hypothetical protein
MPLFDSARASAERMRCSSSTTTTVIVDLRSAPDLCSDRIWGDPPGRPPPSRNLPTARSDQKRRLRSRQVVRPDPPLPLNRVRLSHCRRRRRSLGWTRGLSRVCGGQPSPMEQNTMTTIAGRHDRPGLAADATPITGEMPELLEIAVEAHGGLARWNNVSSIKIDVSIGGAIWYVKGQPDVLKDIVMVADTERERVTTSFVGQDRTTSFEPDQVLVRRSDGTILESSDDPEGSFEGQGTRIRPGTRSMSLTSAARRCGLISIHRSSTHRRALRRRRSTRSPSKGRRGDD